jgi:hypothetical protein
VRRLEAENFSKVVRSSTEIENISWILEASMEVAMMSGPRNSCHRPEIVNVLNLVFLMLYCYCSSSCGYKILNRIFLTAFFCVGTASPAWPKLCRSFSGWNLTNWCRILH